MPINYNHLFISGLGFALRMDDDKGSISDATDGSRIQDGAHQIRDHYMSKARVVILQVTIT